MLDPLTLKPACHFMSQPALEQATPLAPNPTGMSVEVTAPNGDEASGSPPSSCKGSMKRPFEEEDHEGGEDDVVAPVSKQVLETQPTTFPRVPGSGLRSQELLRCDMNMSLPYALHQYEY